MLGRTLWLSVWDWDRFGKHLFLGEVLVTIKTFDLSGYAKRWHLLKDKVGDSRGQKDSTLHTLSLCVAATV